MNLADLSAAYFQYYAIAAYIVIALISGGVALTAVLQGAVSVVPVLAAVVATFFIYPVVWYVLHRYILHSRWMWKSPLTAGTWKRIHYDHHSDPNNLKVLFGALYTTLPTVALATVPVGYALALDRRASCALHRRHTNLCLRILSLHSALGILAEVGLGSEHEEISHGSPLPQRNGQFRHYQFVVG